MSQWKNDDSTANSVLWGVTGYNLRANTVNANNFYNNVSISAFTTNEIVGQFGVDTTEIGVAAGNVVHVTITTNGSGYAANVAMIVAEPAVGAGVTANAVANSIGRIASASVQNAGGSYIISPTFTIPLPANNGFNGNTGVVNSYISFANSTLFATNDYVTYFVISGNTAVGGLTNASSYYVQDANTTQIALTTTLGGPKLTLVANNLATSTGHFIRGQQATAVGTVSGGKNTGIAHAGWNVRKVGTGGRAGRVQYETLVAMGSMTSDASDDTVLPDA